LPLAHTGSPFFALDAAASKAARQASIATGARSVDREPRSMYGKLNRSEAAPSSFMARVNPLMKG
jgi:hypothetical protein